MTLATILAPPMPPARYREQPTPRRRQALELSRQIKAALRQQAPVLPALPADPRPITRTCDHSEILRLWCEGLTTREIEEAGLCTQRHAAKLLRTYGVPTAPKPPAPQAPPRPSRWPVLTDAEFTALWPTRESLAALAKEMRRDRNVLRARAQRLGLDMTPPPGAWNRHKQRREFAPRTCAECPETLVRRKNESTTNFIKRQHCGHICGRKRTP